MHVRKPSINIFDYSNELYNYENVTLIFDVTIH